jgi:hypothetical protein
VRSKALLFAIVVAVVCDIGLIVLALVFGAGGDFRVFWTAANSTTPYAASAQPFGSPPTALLLFQTLSFAPLWAGLVMWTALGVAAYLIAARGLYGRSAALLALVSPPAIQTLVAGQVSFIVSALIFAAFQTSPIAAGMLLGYAVALKPQMAFLAPLLFLFARRWDALAGFLAALLLLSALATAGLGLGIWRDWLVGVTNLLAVADERGATGLAVSPASYGVPHAIAAVVAVVALYFARQLEPPAQAAALVGCSLVAAPYALTYDLVAIVPLVALWFLATGKGARGRGEPTVGAVASDSVGDAVFVELHVTKR